MTTPTRPMKAEQDSEQPVLSDRQFLALQEACGPVGLLSFPPLDVIRVLRQYGYVTIVLGGIQITPLGLERLLRERRVGRSTPC